MSWRTHAILGANAVWLAAISGIIDQWTVGLAAAGAFAGLLPDIDATRAKIHFVGGGILSAFKGSGKNHRGFFHSLLMIVLIFVLSMLAFLQLHPLLPFVVTLGYASHPFIDGFNRPGVSYLWPLKYKIRFVPKNLAPKVDGMIDQGIFFVGVLTLTMFVLVVYYPYLKTFSTSPFLSP